MAIPQNLANVFKFAGASLYIASPFMFAAHHLGFIDDFKCCSSSHMADFPRIPL